MYIYISYMYPARGHIKPVVISIHSRGRSITQLAKMSLDEILDITVFFLFFFNMTSDRLGIFSELAKRQMRTYTVSSTAWIGHDTKHFCRIWAKTSRNAYISILPIFIVANFVFFCPFCLLFFFTFFAFFFFCSFSQVRVIKSVNYSSCENDQPF